MLSFGWTAPFTNRLLIEARSGTRRESYTFDPDEHPFVNLINVTEQLDSIPGLSYRGGGIGAANQPYLDTDGLTWNTAGVGAYITGSHAIKVGFGNLWNRRFNHWEPRRAQPQEARRRLRRLPFQQRNPESAHAACDALQPPGQAALGPRRSTRRTRGRCSGSPSTPASGSITTPATRRKPISARPARPTRDITFPETQMLSFKDIVPRLGATIDLFGTQKTALKLGLNKYTQALGTQVGFMNGALDPVSSLALFVTRSWNDNLYSVGDPRRGNFVPDCDLINVLANGECGVVSDTNFGQPTRSTTSDPDTVRRMGQPSLSVGVLGRCRPASSRRGCPRSFGYFRRSFGNFTVVDNLALAATDFSPFTVTAPGDSRLPDGGSYSISAVPRPQSRYADAARRQSVRLASEYGDQTQVWSGVDLSVNARMASGIVVSGGMSTGRTLTDNCEILAAVPEAGLLAARTAGSSPTF